MPQGYAGKEHSNPTAQADRWRDVRSESITPTQQQITAGYQGHHSHSRVKHNKENIFPYLIVHDCFISTVSYLHSLPAPASYYKLCAAKLLNFHQSRVGMTDFNRDHGVGSCDHFTRRRICLWPYSILISLWNNHRVPRNNNKGSVPSDWYAPFSLTRHVALKVRCTN